jgi:hypothetical protein
MEKATKKPQNNKDGSRHVSAMSTLWAGALMAALWFLLVGEVHRDDTIVGCVCILLSILVLRLIAGVRQQETQIKLRDLLTGWRIPWDAAQDIFLVSRALLRDLLMGIPPASTYRVCGFKTSKSDPSDVGRRVLVTGYSSATPNVIIIGVDYAQSRILFHQLEPSTVSQTMWNLGARA